MGESSACLMRTFSQPSPTSSEEKKGNPLHRALTTSISFGRFVSESLDWEKWSAFTHNRYLEEVERYSKPGSVAEKKAYFEAHFKRRRAAALLEQQNAAAEQKNLAANDSEANTFAEDRDSYVATEDIKEGGVQNSIPVLPVGLQNASCDASIERMSEKSQLEEVEKVTKLPVLIENGVELTDHLESDGCISDHVVSKNQDKDDSAVRNSASSGQKETEASSSKMLPSGGASKCAVKQTLPVQLRNSEKSTKIIKKNETDSSNKRRSYATSLHMSVNFASYSGKTKKASFPCLPKVENSILIRAPAKKHKNSMLPQSSTGASVSGIFKDHSSAVPSEEKRIRMPFGDSVSGMRTVDGKMLSPSTSFSKSSSVFGNKARSPTVASSFTFKSEERASRRKEKLEEKLKLMDIEKQLRSKSQVKGRSNSKDLRNSTVLKSKKDAEAHPVIESPFNLTKKIPAVRPCFPKIEERALKFQINNESRPPWRISVKTEGLTGNNVRPPIYSTKCLPKKSPNENASPNIQP